MDHDRAEFRERALKEELAKRGAYIGDCNAREMTAGEHLDRQIDAAQRHLDALRDLKASLPGSYLNSGADRITPLLARLTVG